MSLFKKAIVGNDNEKKLPNSRFEQFFFLYKNNFLLLFYSSILFFIFLFPSIFNFIVTYINYYNHITNDEVINGSQLFNIILTSGLIMIPCFLFLGLGSAGVYNVVLRLIYEKGSYVKDFFIGIKKYWLRFIIIYLIEGLLIFFLFFNYGAYYYVEMNAIVKLFSLIISVIFLILYLLIKPFIIVQMYLFNNNKFQITKNSFILMFSRFFKALLYLIFSYLLFVGVIFFIEEALIVNVIIIVMIQGGLSTMISCLFAIQTIELNVNKEDYKDIYRLGLKR